MTSKINCTIVLEREVSEFPLPVDPRSVDRIFLWSVFTHMSVDVITYYLHEFERILKKDGMGFASCFIVDKEILAHAQLVNSTPWDLKFKHSYGEGCFINNLQVPMGAVAYTEEKIDALLDACNLERESHFFRGSWSGYWELPADGQDGFCFGRKDDKKDDSVRFLSRIFATLKKK